VEEAQNQLDIETAKAIQSVKSEYDTAVLEEQQLTKALEGAKADVQDLGRKSVDYNVMEREAKSNRTALDTLLTQEKELNVTSNSRANNVRIINAADVPK